VPHFRLPETNVLRSYAFDVTFVVDDACSSTACTDIDTDVVRHLDTQLTKRIDLCLGAAGIEVLIVKLDSSVNARAKR
jgi:hypothetical protein